MPLYTFVADYDGGTYISQVTAPNPKAAVFAWAENLEVKAIPKLGAQYKAKLLQALRQDEENEIGYVSLNGVTNVWFVCPRVRGKLMFVNFIQTEQKDDESS